MNFLKKICNRSLLSIYGIFVLALGLRFAYLFYNLSWQLPDLWPSMAGISLVAAEVILKKALSFPIEPAVALDMFHFDDRGLSLLHILFYEVLGASSLLHVQIFNLVLDSLMVFVAYFVGVRMFDKRFGLILALAYAFFLPQVFTSIQPLWYSALNAGNFLLVLFAVQLHKNEEYSKKRLIIFSFLVFLVTSVVAQFRSTIIFFPICIAILCLLYHRKNNKIFIHSFLLGGILAIVFSSLLNKQFTGMFSPTRSNTGHCFWVGVGEFPNPYGVIESDDAIYKFYFENTGKNMTFANIESMRAYEGWLKSKAVSFVSEHPLMYASMVFRRSMKIVFPNFRLQRVADEIAYAEYVEKTASQRLSITKSGKLFTPQGIRALWSLDKAFVLELVVRALFFFLLPAGAFMGFWQMRHHPLLPILLSGFVYGLATISPLRGPAMNHYSIWSITLPLVVLGWYCLLKKKS